MREQATSDTPIRALTARAAHLVDVVEAHEGLRVLANAEPVVANIVVGTASAAHTLSVARSARLIAPEYRQMVLIGQSTRRSAAIRPYEVHRTARAAAPDCGKAMKRRP